MIFSVSITVKCIRHINRKTYCSCNTDTFDSCTVHHPLKGYTFLSGHNNWVNWCCVISVCWEQIALQLQKTDHNTVEYYVIHVYRVAGCIPLCYRLEQLQIKGQTSWSLYWKSVKSPRHWVHLRISNTCTFPTMTRCCCHVDVCLYLYDH